MDSGRFLLAVVLMIGLVVVTNIIFPPVRQAPPAALPDSLSGAVESPATPVPAVDAAAGSAAVATPLDTPAGASGDAPPPPVRPDPGASQPPAATVAEPVPEVATAPPDTVIAQSSLFRYGVSTHGAGIVLAELVQHRSYDPGSPDGPVELVPDGDGALVAYDIEFGRDVIPLDRLVFTAGTTGVVEVVDTGIVRFVHADSASGFRVEFEYHYRADEYLVDVRARAASPLEVTPRLLIRMGPTLRSNEAEPDMDAQNLAYVVNSDQEGIISVPLRNVDAQRTEEGPLDFVALKNKYFVAAAVRAGTQPFGGLNASPTGVPNEADLAAGLLPEPDGWFAFTLYLGPQEPERLAAASYQLRDVYVFGWKFLQPVLRPIGHGITWALVGTHRVLGLGYGWVLMAFGVLIRLLLWPLNATAMRSQLKTMELQPRIKELQTKYKSDPQRMQKEMLKLYKEEGFNPMGGCLPMLIPFPILIALFFVFQSTIEFRGVGFLWLPDLSMPDPIYALPILLGVSMFALQLLNYRAAPPGQQQTQMKIMMYVMPVFMTVLFFRFASGLNLYYATMNFASLPQQLQIIKERRRHHARRAAAS